MRCKRQVHAVMATTAGGGQFARGTGMLSVVVAVLRVAAMSLVIRLDCHVAIRPDAKYYAAHAGAEHNHAHPASQRDSYSSVSGFHNANTVPARSPFNNPENHTGG
jgi:hypothetical protein